jgi:hypothetical protein
VTANGDEAVPSVTVKVTANIDVVVSFVTVPMRKNTHNPGTAV